MKMLARMFVVAGLMVVGGVAYACGCGDPSDPCAINECVVVIERGGLTLEGGSGAWIDGDDGAVQTNRIYQGIQYDLGFSPPLGAQILSDGAPDTFRTTGVVESLVERNADTFGTLGVDSHINFERWNTIQAGGFGGNLLDGLDPIQ